MSRRKTKRRMNDKQALTVIISVACAAALLIAALVVIGPILGGNENADPHAGHDHGTANGGHYEGDGHDHGTSDANAKVKYSVYTNADKTFHLVIRDQKNAVVFEVDKLEKAPIPATIDEEKGIHELGWATGTGPNDFACVYYNEKTGQVSGQFVAPRGTDGVRIAYGSEDQTKVIVQDVFNKDTYYKEYTLANAVEKNGNIIVGGKLQVDKKTVVISYNSSEKDATEHTSINLYA